MRPAEERGSGGGGAPSAAESTALRHQRLPNPFSAPTRDTQRSDGPVCSPVSPGCAQPWGRRSAFYRGSALPQIGLNSSNGTVGITRSQAFFFF